MKRPVPAAVVVLGHARTRPLTPSLVGPPAAARTRVLVADPAPAARAGIRRFLAGALDVVVSGEAATGAEALHAARSAPHDVLLLHERLADPDAFEVLGRLRSENLPLRVVLMGDAEATGLQQRALELGASGSLDARATPEEFVAAVRASARQKARSRPLPAGDAASPAGALAAREFQVLRLLAQGRRTSEIGQALALAPSTVRTYKARLREKLGLQSDSALVRFALERRIA